MRTTRTSIVVLALVVLPLLAAACSGSGDAAPDEGSKNGPHRGGTLTILMTDKRLTHLDPQRIYTGDELALGGGYLHRTLNAYRVSSVSKIATQLVPDLATGTGDSNADATSWSWTLRRGLRWEDGSELTCADVKYGVSRSFATDVITDGPAYAVSMLDIPVAADGSSVYKGPYVTSGNDVAAFDRAVVCRGDEITFHLNRPTPDFDYTVTLLAFGPVPRSADDGEDYDRRPMSSGPYRIAESSNARLVLERNKHWTRAADPLRGAYPDQVVLRFGLDPNVVDQRMIRDVGEDRSSLTTIAVQPQSLPTVFEGTSFAGRRVDAQDLLVHYLVVNTTRIPDVAHRRAIAVGLDRAQMLTVLGGTYAGKLADGVITPNLPADYRPSGMWRDIGTAPVPATGDPAQARALLDEAAEPLGQVRFDYDQSPTNDKLAAAVVDSLAEGGIEVRANPIEWTRFYDVVQDPATEGDLALFAWAPDWANASTVIPQLLTPSGAYNLSHVDDAGFTAAVDDALVTTNRDAQAEKWMALNERAMSQAWVIPLRFGRVQRLAGSAVRAASGESDRVYLWTPFSSWPYSDLYLAD